MNEKVQTYRTPMWFVVLLCVAAPLIWLVIGFALASQISGVNLFMALMDFG